MAVVTVLIFHPPTPHRPGGLHERLAATRRALADAHAVGLRALGADVRIVEEGGALAFGTRITAAVRDLSGGAVVMGSGAIPLAGRDDLQAFVDAAAVATARRSALANNRYSADVIAVPDAAWLRGVPENLTDNAVPRWLEDVRGVRVDDLRHVWHLQVDLDSPLDTILAACDPRCPEAVRSAGERLLQERPHLHDTLGAVSAVLDDPSAELLVAGRTSAATLAWLESAARCRVRALVEERGMKSGGGANRRVPRSILGELLDHDGPDALGPVLGRLADAALVDSRVLLAHRLGVGEDTWPDPEDRFASDLLDPALIADPWLRALTESARDAPTPVLLGAHTLVGPGVRLVRPRRARGLPSTRTAVRAGRGRPAVVRAGRSAGAPAGDIPADTAPDAV